MSFQKLSSTTARIVVLILIMISFPVILVVDLYLTPWRVPAMILYAIPIMIAARLFSIPATIGVIVVAIGFGVLNAGLTGIDIQSEILAVLALAIIGLLSLAWANAERRSVLLAEERTRLLEQEQERSAELEDSRARLLEFFSMVAHDLRGPATTIAGFTELMLRANSLPPDQRQKIASGVKSSVRQIVRLSDDLLDASRIGTGRFEIEKSPGDLVALCSEIVERKKLTAPRHRLMLDARIERLEGRFDRDRIAQAISNLVDNAIKYSPEGREVRVVAERAGDRAKVAVSDQGIGIAQEDIPRLFQPYVRLRYTQGIKGLGLGLYIVKGIVEAHKGTISVQSEPSKGSTFIVDLPLDDPP